MIKKLLSTTLLSIIISCGFSQQTIFSKVYYQGGGSTNGNGMIEAFNNGYLICGNHNNNAFLLRIDTSGTVMWSKKYGNPNYSTGFNQVIRTNDSCYVVAGGLLNSSTNKVNMACVKLNALGDTLWSRLLFTTESEAFSIQQTFDKGYIVAGISYQSGPPNSKMVAVKMDSVGNIQWQKTLSPGNSENYCASIKQTADSGYVMVGTTTSSPDYLPYATITKLTSSGNVTWSNKYNRSAVTSTWGSDIICKTDGYVCYAIAGGNPVLMKTDFSGNVMWSNNYSGYADPCNCVTPKLYQTNTGDYIFTDGSKSLGAGSGQSLFSVDSTGNLNWQNYTSMYPLMAIKTRDNGYAILGNGPVYGVHPMQNYDPQIGFLKTNFLGLDSLCSFPSGGFVTADQIIETPISTAAISSTSTVNIHPAITNVSIADYVGCVSFLGGEMETETGNDFSVFPNPFLEQTSIKFNSPTKNSSVEMMDILGNSILNVRLADHLNDYTLISKGLKPGIYLLRVTSDKGFMTQRIIIQ